MAFFGRDFEAPPRPTWTSLPGEWRRCGLAIYRWGRAQDALAIQRARALAFPRWTDRDLFAPECLFKLYEEVPGPHHRELLIECKVCLTVEAWAEGRWCAQLYPLRGTDWWPVLGLLMRQLGEPETMIHDGGDGVLVWFASTEESRALAVEACEIHDTSRHSGWEDR